MKGETIDIKSRFGNYQVVVGAGICKKSSFPRVLLKKAKKVAIVSQQNILDLHGHKLLEALSLSAEKTIIKTVCRGERAKSFTTLQRLWQELLEEGFTRDSVIIAFGGGVVGDLAGFVAATLLRGIAWINVPTTLLAQVDASVGGKTGINVPQGKNLVGAFYPPQKVVVDTNFLSTLNRREVKSGIGEVVKYAIGIDDEVWRLCQKDFPNNACTQEMVKACLLAKAKVVITDEQEGGLRKILNLGHTLAHAIEGAAPGIMSHGEAVAVGLRYVLSLSLALGEAKESYVKSSLELLDRAKLANHPPADLSYDSLLPFWAVDKKAGKGGLTWVLPVAPGRSILKKGVKQSLLSKVYGKF